MKLKVVCTNKINTNDNNNNNNNNNDNNRYFLLALVFGCLTSYHGPLCSFVIYNLLNTVQEKHLIFTYY